MPELTLLMKMVTLASVIHRRMRASATELSYQVQRFHTETSVVGKNVTHVYREILARGDFRWVADRHVLRPRLFVELLEFVIDGLDAEFLGKNVALLPIPFIPPVIRS
jgi:hypothetical protein